MQFMAFLLQLPKRTKIITNKHCLISHYAQETRLAGWGTKGYDIVFLWTGFFIQMKKHGYGPMDKTIIK